MDYMTWVDVVCEEMKYLRSDTRLNEIPEEVEYLRKWNMRSWKTWGDGIREEMRYLMYMEYVSRWNIWGDGIRDVMKYIWDVTADEMECVSRWNNHKQTQIGGVGSSHTYQISSFICTAHAAYLSGIICSRWLRMVRVEIEIMGGFGVKKGTLITLYTDCTWYWLHFKK